MTTEIAAPIARATTSEQPFRMLVAVVNEATSDGRIFDSLDWRTPPLTVYSQFENLPGHDGAPVSGRIDAFERIGNEVWADGSFDLGGDAGRETVRLVEGGYLRGVSVDAAVLDVAESTDGLMHFSGEIGAVTVVGFPAFRDTQVELVAAAMDSEPLAERSEITSESASTIDFGTGVSLIAAARPVGPPRAWFDQPDLDRRSGLHVDTERVWGHIYGWGECHLGSPPGRCIQVPRGGSYDYIIGVDGRGVLCDDGTLVQTGPITITADHANLRASWLQAKDHYAHTGLAVADVTCGEDDHGIWVAGRIRPGAPTEIIEALRASAPSGDWRLVGGRLNLVAILSVNTPGFPALAASFDGADLVSLVASSSVAQGCGCGGNELAERVEVLEAELERYTRPEREARLADVDRGVAPARLALAERRLH